MRRDPSSLRSVGMTGTRLLFSVLCTLYSVLCYLYSVLCYLYLAFMRSLTLAPSGVDRWFAVLQDDKYASIVLCSLLSVICYLFSIICYLYSVICTLLSVLCYLYSISRTSLHIRSQYARRSCATFRRRSTHPR